MMPQLRSLVALLLVATAVAAVVAVAAAGGGFVVTGRIYCDNCRAGFETNISHAIQGPCTLIDLAPAFVHPMHACMPFAMYA
jgi:hypothetical protein